MGRFGPTFFALSLLLCASACRPAAPSAGSGVRKPDEDRSELQMTDMRAQSYADSGLEWELSAPYGEMYTQKNLMRVKNMTVALFQNSQKSSDISAGLGFMSTGSGSKGVLRDPILSGVRLAPGDMFVTDNVVVVSTDGTKLTTDWAIYSKRTDLITSTAPVQVVRSDSVTKGVGLEASSDLSKVKIFNEILIIPDKSEGVTP